MASRSVSLSHDRSPPMFQARSLNRGEIATDLAIPLIVERGWQGLTITALAESGNMRKQSVAQWFGTLDKFRERIAWRYSWRWSILISSRTDRLYGERADGEGADASTLTRALLPRDDDGSRSLACGSRWSRLPGPMTWWLRQCAMASSANAD